MPRESFYSDNESTPLNRQQSLVPLCGACGLLKKCRSPQMPVWGDGKREVMIVGEAPGEHEDRDGRPFHPLGKSGERLRKTLKRIGVDLDKDCWTTNSLICRPPHNQTPTPQQIGYCRPNLLAAFAKYKPKVVILLGGAAIRSVIGYFWKESPGEVDQWVRWQIPSQQINAWICPSWHPSLLLRASQESPQLGAILDLWFDRHLESAFALKNRPWKEVPRYDEKVRIITNVRQAAEELQIFFHRDRVSFDFECNRLKPDHDDAAIYSCAVSDGETTIAFPWQGDVIGEMRYLLLSNQIVKLGHNIKYEDRWCARVFGKGVQNWDWDGMISAHLIDNRKNITSLKFQSFVLLGQGDYSSAIKPFLTSTPEDKKKYGANAPNRIHKAPLRSLLKYNGMDALLTWYVSKKQKEIMQWQKTEF